MPRNTNRGSSATAKPNISKAHSQYSNCEITPLELIRTTALQPLFDIRGLKIIIAILAVLLLADNAQAQAKSFEILNREVPQGGVIIIKVFPQFQTKVQGPPVCVAVKWDGLEQPGEEYGLNNRGEVFIGVDINTEPKIYIVFLVECGRGNRLDWYYDEVKIIDADFPERARRPFIPTKRWKQERRKINEVFESGNYWENYTNGEFIQPLERSVLNDGRTVGDVLSPFGAGHAGVDLATLDSDTGKHRRPVKAINSGKVALIAKNFSTDGHMVIIDHGSGIFSVYMHLSNFAVRKAGDSVKKGDVIGISGRSGRVSGPHLHFAVKVRGVYIDPLGFIDTMNQYIR